MTTIKMQIDGNLNVEVGEGDSEIIVKLQSGKEITIKVKEQDDLNVISVELDECESMSLSRDVGCQPLNTHAHKIEWRWYRT